MGGMEHFSSSFTTPSIEQGLDRDANFFTRATAGPGHRPAGEYVPIPRASSPNAHVDDALIAFFSDRRITEMMVNRYKYFRWTPRTAWISFVYIVAIPASIGFLGYQQDVSRVALLFFVRLENYLVLILMLCCRENGT